MMCQCAGPGPCSLRGVVVSQRMWEVCSGNFQADHPCPPEKREAYLRVWSGVDWSAAGVDWSAAGMGQTLVSAPAHPAAEKLKHCRHRGRAIRDEAGKARERLCTVG